MVMETEMPGKQTFDQTRFPNMGKDSKTAQHNHDTGETGQRWAYAGYSEKAPHYHLWRCGFVPVTGPFTGKVCGATRISMCINQLDLNRGVTESLHQECSTCKSLRRRHAS